MEPIDPLASFFERAQKSRIPMSRICERAGVAPTTPSRWKHDHNSASLPTIMKLQKALAELAAESSEAA